MALYRVGIIRRDRNLNVKTNKNKGKRICRKQDNTHRHEKGIVKIWYMPSPFSAEKVVIAKFKECDFVDDEKWKIQ